MNLEGKAWYQKYRKMSGSGSRVKVLNCLRVCLFYSMRTAVEVITLSICVFLQKSYVLKKYINQFKDRQRKEKTKTTIISRNVNEFQSSRPNFKINVLLLETYYGKPYKQLTKYTVPIYPKPQYCLFSTKTPCNFLFLLLRTFVFK